MRRLKFVTIVNGIHSSCGILADGRNVCGGSNRFGALGIGSSENWYYGLAPIASDEPFVSISLAWYTGCGVTAAGAAYCWGTNGDHVLGDGTLTHATAPVPFDAPYTWRQVQVGAWRHACGLTVDGDIYCWGAALYPDPYGPAPAATATPAPTLAPPAHPTPARPR